MGIQTAIWEKWVEFKYEWGKITSAAIVSPLLYMIALGWGLGSMTNVGDRPYIDFLVPGVIALTTMNSSFSAVANPLNIQRIFEHSFEQIIISPTSFPQYVIGQSIGGALRGMYGGVLVLLLAIPFGSTMEITPMFLLVMFLNGLTFASLGITAAILSVTHADVSRFSTFAILPMTFLCNTFFPLDEVPAAIKTIIEVLPLTHTSSYLRDVAYGYDGSWTSILVLVIYSVIFISMSIYFISKRKNL